MTDRKPYQAKPVTNPWWLTEEGIRGHYADQREEADAQHRERVKRINDEELAALDGWAKHIKDNYVGKPFTVTGRDEGDDA